MNRKHTTALMVGMATVFFFASTAGAATLEEIEKSLEAKCKKLKSYSGKSHMTSDSDMGGGNGTKTKMDMTIEWMREGEKQLYRSEGTNVSEMKFGDNVMTTKTKMLSIGDGKYLYTLSESDMNKVAMKMNWDESMGSHNALKHLKKDLNLKVLPDKKVGEYDCYVIEGKPKTMTQSPNVSKIVHCFDKDSGVSVHMTMFDTNGKKTAEMTMKEFKLNPKISKDRFVFKLPKGMELMDMTNVPGAPGSKPAEEKKPEEKKEEKK